MSTPTQTLPRLSAETATESATEPATRPLPRISSGSAQPAKRSRWNLLFLAAGVLTLGLQAEGLFGISSVPAFIAENNLDKGIHLAMFAVPVMLFVLAGMPRMLVLFIAAAGAVGSEWAQGAFTAARTNDPQDIVADLAGIGLGLLLTLGVRQRRPLAGLGAQR